MSIPQDGLVIALAGGVGGAKLADGLARVLPPERLLIAVNTADDFEHLGLHVSPDLDTVMYTLAGRNNAETGWGLAGETWSFMEATEALGGETWFRLGDRDLATHVERTRALRAGRSLSEVTATLAARFGIGHQIVPMSDDPVRTVVSTEDGELPFQHYFVRLACAPRVSGFTFEGIAAAEPAPRLAAALADSRLAAIVICPSNPYVSVAPIIGIRAMAAALAERRVPVVAVSPIVGGRALKGPAAKMMEELGVTPSAESIARFYDDRVDGIVIDTADAALAARIEALGTRVHVTETVMKDAADRRALADEAVAFAGTIEPRRA